MVAKREYQNQMREMEPERALPAGLLEYKYNPIIGFKQFIEGESGKEHEIVKQGKRRNNSTEKNNSSIGSDYKERSRERSDDRAAANQVSPRSHLPQR